MPTGKIIYWRFSKNAVVLRERRFSDGSAIIETDEGTMLVEALAPWGTTPIFTPALESLEKVPDR